MEHFVIIVNGWKPLTIITKCSILDVVAVLDPPLITKYICKGNIYVYTIFNPTHVTNFYAFGNSIKVYSSVNQTLQRKHAQRSAIENVNNKTYVFSQNVKI